MRAMKISAVKLLQLRGEMPFEGEFWEARLVRPLDLYPQHRDDPPGYMAQSAEGRYRMEGIFVRIETDEGVYGTGGPLPHEQASLRPGRAIESSGDGYFLRLRSPIAHRYDAVRMKS